MSFHFLLACRVSDENLLITTKIKVFVVVVLVGYHSFFPGYLWNYYYFGCAWSSLLCMGLSLVAASGVFSCCRAQTLGMQASAVAAGGISSCGAWAWVPCDHMGSSRIRDWTHVPCIGRQVLIHCATRTVLKFFVIGFLSFSYHVCLRSFCIEVIRCSLSFKDVCIQFFYQVLEVLSYYFFKQALCFFLPFFLFWDTHYPNVILPKGVR